MNHPTNHPVMPPVPTNVKEQHEKKKNQFFAHVDRISLSSKLVACTICVLLIGITVISISIRTLVGNYMLEKTDNQLIQQSELVINNIEYLVKQQEQNAGNASSSPNSYFVQLQYTDGTKDSQGNPLTANLLMPQLNDGIVSVPVLPANGDTKGITLGQPFTTQAHARQIVRISGDTGSGSDNKDSDANSGSDLQDSSSGVTITLANPSPNADHDTIVAANSPWRIIPAYYTLKNGEVKGIVYVGLSLYDQIDTINTLTRYCLIVGIAVVLLAGSLATLIIQHTMTPLKRMEKTAAKIAAGDLSQRIPSAPENTEVGSLAASLNTMLARIETSFHEQQDTTDKMKQFVSDASHELRTPLAAIHGYAELYKMQRDMPGALERADESIAHIERSSQRMTVLVEDLLSLARLDEGRGIDVTGTVNLTSLLTDAVDDLHALDPDRVIGRTNIALVPSRDLNHPATLTLAEGDWPAITLPGDASRLRQVVTNIVGNIHRYTPADSPAEAALGILPAAIEPRELGRMPATDASLRRFIEAAEVGASMQVGYRYAVLQFVDHGPGVPDENRSRIFERFYTADPSRARQTGGTGLGLAIVQSVVKAHHGFICATASDGGGLTFTVVLPVDQIAAPAVPAQTDTKTGKAKTSWFSSNRQQ